MKWRDRAEKEWIRANKIKIKSGVVDAESIYLRKKRFNRGKKIEPEQIWINRTKSMLNRHTHSNVSYRAE